MRDLDRLSRMRSDTSENRVGSFALGFFGLLCIVAVGFMSELRAPVSNSVDYGYDEQLGAQTPSLSGAKLVANCSDKGATIVGAAAMDSLDELRARASPLAADRHQLRSFTTRRSEAILSSRRFLLIVGAPALLRQIAVGAEFASRCVDLATVRAATTGEANKLIELTSDQWQFLRGIYAS
jgi:hypothetical protein